jgi:beta-lactam-binding protein with PASTA domain
MDQIDTEKEIDKSGFTVVRQHPHIGIESEPKGDVVLVASTCTESSTAESANVMETDTAELPDIAGQTLKQAVIGLKQTGFNNIKPEPVKDSAARGTVIRVEVNGEIVQAGKEYEKTSKIILFVSTGKQAPKSRDDDNKNPKEQHEHLKPLTVNTQILGANPHNLAQILRQKGWRVDHRIVNDEQKIGQIIGIQQIGEILALGDTIEPDRDVILLISGGRLYQQENGAKDRFSNSRSNEGEDTVSPDDQSAPAEIITDIIVPDVEMTGYRIGQDFFIPEFTITGNRVITEVFIPELTITGYGDD